MQHVNQPVRGHADERNGARPAASIPAVKTIPVHTTSGCYEVRVGPGLLPRLGREMKLLGLAGRCVVVSGEQVFPIYGETVLESLRSEGFEADAVVFPTGENTKSLEKYGELEKED